MQAKSQLVPLHTAVAFVGVVQAAQTPEQKRRPASQAKVQPPLTHERVAFAGAVHGVQLEPQLSAEVLDRHWLPQRWKPGLQVKSHAVPLHTGAAFAGVVHAAQVEPQSRKPASQVRPQLVPSQVEVPLGVAGHAVQELPQLSALVFDTQARPHACWPEGQAHMPLVHAPPMGQSAVTRQPSVQRFVIGSHVVPAGHQPATTQSSGSASHAPRLQTLPAAQACPQAPQSSALLKRSTQSRPHWVSAPAHMLPPPPPAPPPVGSVLQRPTTQVCACTQVSHALPPAPHAVFSFPS